MTFYNVKANRKCSQNKAKRWLFLTTNLLCFLKADAQYYYLFHADTDKSCKGVDAYNLYFSIDNRVVIRKAGGLALKNVSLASDSAIVTRINDSIYLVRPLYKDVSFRLFIIDRKNKQAIDSARSFSINIPFYFSINWEKYDPYYTRLIIDNMKILFLEPTCLKYTSDFSILSYELVLKRNDSTILTGSFKGQELIGNSFKENLIKMSRYGDGLFARNIVLKHKDGREKKVDEYGLLKILLKNNE